MGALIVAFCGFYVGSAGEALYNNATVVVLMRDGTRTVLSMQNNYRGPAEDFAMVVPVPVVLQKEDVKTLPREIFGKVDQLASPRLVEYWEQDPCAIPLPEEEPSPRAFAAGIARKKEADDDALGVKVEAKFTVGEYEIVILSAQDSNGLDTWLRREKYNIPAGAEPVLKPYVAAGMKFFVAKVDVEKVQMRDGQAMLSPLRFHYDHEKFELPVRLGLINSSGTQDLIVHILARGKRYEVANYPNVFIPTNLAVAEEARDRFAPFYAALFDATVERNRGAVVTEYSWDAGSCDPCPTPPLQPGDLMTLGADVVPGGAGRGFVLTRLHARYGKDSLGEDLVFREADPVMGGREVWREKERLEEGATKSGVNNFQARYIIRHPWTGPIECKDPVRGIWGGPPGGTPPQTRAATDLGTVARGGIKLAKLVRQDVPELGIRQEKQEPAREEGKKPAHKTAVQKEPKGTGACACEAGNRSRAGAGAGVGLLALLALRRRRWAR